MPNGSIGGCLAVAAILVLIIAFATADWPSRVLRERKPQRAAEQTEPENRPQKIAPGKKYSKYQHATDSEHRTAEQYNWRRQNILAFLTILFAGVAAVFAIKTYYATKLQADTAVDQEIRSLRSYVIVKNVEYKSVVVNKNARIDMTLENLGQTPVYDLTWVSGIQLVGINKAPVFDQPTADGCTTIMRSKEAHHQLMGKDTVISKYSETNLSDAEVGLVNEGKWSILYVGRICYKDIYKIVRTTDFCSFYHKIEDGSFVAEVCEFAHPTID